MRKSPNIIITGTPGVGKSTHAEQLAKSTGLKHVSINQIAKERDCYDGYDDELKTWIVDEDKLLDALEADAMPGGLILDWHACDPFPESWIDLVVVLRCGTESLFDRLQARGYSEAKLQGNMDAEIMDELINEAREAFDNAIVQELKSETAEDVEQNVERIAAWVTQWKKDQDEKDREGEGEEKSAT